MGHGVLHKKSVSAKVRYKNIHGDRDNWCERISTLRFMADSFFAWSGILNIEQYSVPRQPK